MKKLFKKSDRKKKQLMEERYQEKLNQSVMDIPIYEELQKNLDYVSERLGKPVDLIMREFTIKYTQDHKAAVLFIDGLIEKSQIHNHILRPLMLGGELLKSDTDLWELATQSLVQFGEAKTVFEIRTVVDAILSGDTVMLINGYARAFVLGSKGWPTSSIQEPRTENVVRGTREGMSDSINFSQALIRRRLKDPDLRVELFELGSRSHTFINLFYIDGVIDPAIVDEVKRRIEQIDIDGILESGYIEELIVDQIYSPFPQIQTTERPDVVVSHLLEGQVAIVVDGTPHVLIAPAIFTQFYHSPEDYYERFYISTFLRFVRMVSLFIALFLPALYVAFVSYHPEMIPSQLAIAMAAGREPVPFIPILEALIMEFSVEILKEASIRLPGPVGPTIGIVGALVVGDAAVSAGLISPAMVIVVGLTTISSYANPNYNAAIPVRLMRFPFMILASIFGLYGIMLGFLLLCIHLVQLKSFGVPYMAPYAPFHWSDLKDSILRVSWKQMISRPSLYRPKDPIRQKKEGSKTNE